MEDAARCAMLAYYRSLPSRGRRSGKCEMSLPEGLAGLRVLDVCCRAGKGAYEISDYVGDQGFVHGVDPDSRRIERARSNAADNHWACGRWQRYLRFSCGCPEDLSAAGVLDSSYDLVYINCELSATWDMRLALSEFARVLRPGGRLWVAKGVFRASLADKSGPGTVKKVSSSCACRYPGNVFVRALSRDEFDLLCRSCGFSSCEFTDTKHVEPDGVDDVRELDGISFESCDACAFR